MKFSVISNYISVAVVFMMRISTSLAEWTNKANPPSLTRGTINGLAYANFVAHKFHYLNITILGAAHVNKGNECGFACVNTLPCFSFNLAAFPDINGRLLCELLSPDKYNNSDKFVSSQIFHHYSIWSECSSGPCLNNGTCVSMYEQNTYSCVCAAGYTGKNCEAPLECHQYSVLSEADRHRSYGRGFMSDDSLSPGWYRFQHSSYSKMLDTCISHHRCNTDLTGWLKGGHPTVTDGVVTRDACFHGYHNCCYRRVQIRVRDCNGFYVYELKPSPVGNFRYCTTN